MSNFLRVASLSKQYAGERVLQEVGLELAGARTLSILGRSGSGKTTLLKILAGLEPQDAGEIELASQNLAHTPPQRRNMVYLYQEPLLFPHLDIFENVAFGLRLRKLPAAHIRAKTNALLEELGLAVHAKKMAHEVSGGQRQRAAFGRALIVEPKLLLLDEPFGALDVETRAAMQLLFKRVARAQKITSIFVTHDLKEAIIVGDQYGYLECGRLQVYPNRPAFLAHPSVGAAEEIRFWRRVADDSWPANND